MSLLLDALKKAAEDKQKSSGPNDARAEDPRTDRAPVEDEHLELELDDFELPADDDPADDEAPDPADESPLIIDDDPVAPESDDDRLDDLPELREDLPQASTPAEPLPEPAPVPVDSNGPKPQGVDDAQGGSGHDPATDEPDQVQAAAASTPAFSTSGPEPSPQPRPRPEPDTESVSRRPARAVRKPGVSSREALDMMINKSRVATDGRDRAIRNAGIVLIILLLVLGGSYFYFDSQNKIERLQQDNQHLTPQPVAADAEPIPEPVKITPPAKSVAAPAPSPVAAPPRMEASRPAAKSSVARPAPRQQPGTLQITRKSVQDPIDVLLSRAYEKFNAGDYDGANRLYHQVLDREMNNRDALLGTAAVAMKQQRYEYARQKYQSLLVLDPKDSMARAGISAIDSDVNTESRLKFMLREQPEAAHLYFALGSLFASQQRWPEAQQAFFNAWTGEPGNPDYAYNLGISLDQMGKYSQALNVYRDTVKLARGRQVEFSVADVQARIERLGQLENE